MGLLAERSRLNDNLPKVHAMNTFFLEKLLENGYSSVKRWTKKVDIFDHDIIRKAVYIRKAHDIILRPGIFARSIHCTIFTIIMKNRQE